MGHPAKGLDCGAGVRAWVAAVGNRMANRHHPPRTASRGGSNKQRFFPETPERVMAVSDASTDKRRRRLAIAGTTLVVLKEFQPQALVCAARALATLRLLQEECNPQALASTEWAVATLRQR